LPHSSRRAERDHHLRALKAQALSVASASDEAAGPSARSARISTPAPAGRRGRRCDERAARSRRVAAGSALDVATAAANRLDEAAGAAHAKIAAAGARLEEQGQSLASSAAATEARLEESSTGMRRRLHEALEAATKVSESLGEIGEALQKRSADLAIAADDATARIASVGEAVGERIADVSNLVNDADRRMATVNSGLRRSAEELGAVADMCSLEQVAETLLRRAAEGRSLTRASAACRRSTRASPSRSGGWARRSVRAPARAPCARAPSPLVPPRRATAAASGRPVPCSSARCAGGRRRRARRSAPRSRSIRDDRGAASEGRQARPPRADPGGRSAAVTAEVLAATQASPRSARPSCARRALSEAYAAAHSRLAESEVSPAPGRTDHREHARRDRRARGRRGVPARGGGPAEAAAAARPRPRTPHLRPGLAPPRLPARLRLIIEALDCWRSISTRARPTTTER
jgi:hypothetical protein